MLGRCDYCGEAVGFARVDTEGGFWHLEPVAYGSGSDHLATWCEKCGPQHRDLWISYGDETQMWYKGAMMAKVAWLTTGKHAYVSEEVPESLRPTILLWLRDEGMHATNWRQVTADYINRG